MKQEYNSREELAFDIIEKYGLCKGAKFKGFDKYNRMEFEINFKEEKIPVSEISERLNKLNFVDRYYQQLIHLVKDKA